MLSTAVMVRIPVGHRVADCPESGCSPAPCLWAWDKRSLSAPDRALWWRPWARPLCLLSRYCCHCLLFLWNLTFNLADRFSEPGKSRGPKPGPDLRSSSLKWKRGTHLTGWARGKRREVLKHLAKHLARTRSKEIEVASYPSSILLLCEAKTNKQTKTFNVKFLIRTRAGKEMPKAAFRQLRLM